MMELMPIRECFHYISRGKSPQYVDKSKVMVINQACIYWDGLRLEKVKYHDELKEYDKGIVHAGDVLLNSTGTGTLGRAAVVPVLGDDRTIIADSHVTILRPTKRIIPEYFVYYLSYSPNQEMLYSQCVSGSTNQIELSKEKLCSMIIRVPSKETQLSIIAQLKKIDGLIAIRKQQLAKLDELVKARFVEMFGDTILNPFGWEKDLLGTVCDVRDGTHDSPQYYETGYPLVTSKNVTGGKIDLTDCSLICEADFRKINERSKVDMGDIIMPMIGTVGKPVIVDIEPSFAIKNVSLIKFKADSRVLNIYIRALLQSDYFDDAVLSKVRGGTQKFISLGDIRKLEILVPPMELQEQFAAFVAQTDKSKAAIKRSIEALERLKKALMQKYFG